jgi:hypothetical protein
MNGFKGAATKMQPDDIVATAHELDIEPAALRAIMAIEAAGSGFDASGRPKALFERHHFYRWLIKNNKPDVLAAAAEANLAYPKWGTKPYPKGSDAVYAEIEAAYKMAPEEALLSTSWGLGQIMGSNWVATGTGSVEEMVREAMESEGNQLRHMANFIKSTGLIDEIQNKDWAGFAKKYNGPAYAQNQYDVKLASAYERFSA